MDDQVPTVTLYRPIGPIELELVEESGFRRWPPRLPEQPIFYPVTNQQYAKEIAMKWNVKNSGIGYVARFRVNNECIETVNHCVPPGGMDFWGALILFLGLIAF